MFKLNLKIAWRNLIKHKAYTAINILGLAIGLAGFVFMVLFVNHEKSYDTWNKELKNVYQVQEFSDYFTTDKKAHWGDVMDHRLSAIFEAQPNVKAVTMVNTAGRDYGFKIKGGASFLQSNVRRSDSLFFKVFPYEFKYGNAATAFLKPQSIVLREDVAIRYFGDVNPVGKVIEETGGPWNTEPNLSTVTGVVKIPKTPSVIDFSAVYFEDGSYFELNTKWANASEIYIRTNSGLDTARFNSGLQKSYLARKDELLKQDKRSVQQSIAENNSPVMVIKAMADLHQQPLNGESWKGVIAPVLLLSVLLLLVSIINFVNLATALAAGRAKEIGIKKVVGAYKKGLIMQFLIETFLQCLVALFIGLLILEISLPTINESFKLNLSVFQNGNGLLLMLQLAGIVLVAGLLSGLYPSLFLSSYKPGEVLKGNFANSSGGAWIRKALVGVQFVVSASFIIGILVINYQLSFLKNRDNGFTPTGLITMKTYVDESPRDKNFIFRRLKQIDGVKFVSFSSGVIGDYRSSVQDFKYDGEKKSLYGIGMGIEGLQALDARLISGRLFSRDVVADTVNNVIINESAAKMFRRNMVGETLMANDTVPVKVIGVIKDILVEGFESSVNPSIYTVKTESYKGVGYTVKPTTLVRYDQSKSKEVIAEVEKLFIEINQYYPLSYTITEQDFEAVLADHNRFEKMVAVFSVLSLMLSVFGLFALAAFITKQRTKEIAIRKVLGASVNDIFLLLNKGYFWIVLISNSIAFPLTYLLVKRWLASFAYRIEISPLPFLIAFLASVSITILTVTLQARRAVKANPVKALKYE